jgi:hypothetical protein
LVTAQSRVARQNFEDLYLFSRQAGDGAAAGALKLGAPELADRLPALGYALVDNVGEADLAAVCTLTDEERQYLQAGGRVLWLGAEPDCLQMPPVHLQLSIQAEKDPLGSGRSSNTLGSSSPHPRGPARVGPGVSSSGASAGAAKS